jgi:lauroyl/myristoyl acyltransferase
MFWPPRRAVLERATARAGGLIPELDRASFRPRLGGNVARFLARDLLLDGLGDSEVAERFDVRGYEHLRSALAQGRGVVVLGSHFGAHVAAIHWLYREGVPLRLLVQRPRHVSSYLQAQFDRAEGPYPQADFFLRRHMPPSDASARLVSARRALRDGLAVYLSGDVPWPSSSARPGRLMGADRPFLGLWADLAAIARSPVVPVFARFRANGRFSIRFGPPCSVGPGSENEVVARYLERLDALIARHPAEAVAHFTWPCYLDDSSAGIAPAVKSPKAFVAFSRRAGQTRTHV